MATRPTDPAGAHPRELIGSLKSDGGSTPAADSLNRLCSSRSARSRYERLCASLYTARFSAQKAWTRSGGAVEAFVKFRRHPSQDSSILARNSGRSHKSSFVYSNIVLAAAVYRSVRSCLSRSKRARFRRVRNAFASSASKMRFNRFTRFVTVGSRFHAMAYVSVCSSYPVTKQGSHVNCPCSLKYLDTALTCEFV